MEDPAPEPNGVPTVPSILERDPKFRYLISKYDRTEEDWSLREDWSSIHEVGQAFGGQILTREAYEVVENAYLETVQGLLTELQSPSLVFKETRLFREGGHRVSHAPSALEAVRLCRRALREEMVMGELHGEDALHIYFGYDYYMYFVLGEPLPEKVRATATAGGLFVEELDYVPYHDDPPD